MLSPERLYALIGSFLNVSCIKIAISNSRLHSQRGGGACLIPAATAILRNQVLSAIVLPKRERIAQVRVALQEVNGIDLAVVRAGVA